MEETNYKDKYIEKLERENKVLLEILLKKDKIHAIVECVSVGLLCIVMSLTCCFYFTTNYGYGEATTISGDNNSNITDTQLESSDINKN